jgi:hypothetical protein
MHRSVELSPEKQRRARGRGTGCAGGQAWCCAAGPVSSVWSMAPESRRRRLDSRREISWRRGEITVFKWSLQAYCMWRSHGCISTNSRIGMRRSEDQQRPSRKSTSRTLLPDDPFPPLRNRNHTRLDPSQPLYPFHSSQNRTRPLLTSAFPDQEAIRGGFHMCERGLGRWDETRFGGESDKGWRGETARQRVVDGDAGGGRS